MPPNISSLDGTSVRAGTLSSRTAPSGRQADNNVRLDEAARQFEALLIAQLLKSVREQGGAGWLGGGEDPSASSAMELAEEQFAHSLAAQGGLGLARLIVSGLERSDAPDKGK